MVTNHPGLGPARLSQAFGGATPNLSHVSYPKSGHSVVASVAGDYLVVGFPAGVVWT